MPAISRLGHVGVHVKDLERAKQFYRDILGLEVTDEDPGLGVVFMSARPAEEHHELALFGGRNVGVDAERRDHPSGRGVGAQAWPDRLRRSNDHPRAEGPGAREGVRRVDGAFGPEK